MGTLAKDAYWFHHDANARHDPRLTQLKVRHGMAAIGIWWNMVEMLRESGDYSLPLDDATVGTIAYEGMTTPEAARELIAYCVELGLLENGDEHIRAPSLCRRMEAWEEKKQAKVEAGRRGGLAKASNAVANCSSATISYKQNLAKSTEKRRVEKSREEKSKRHPTFDVPMAMGRYDNLVDEWGSAIVDSYVQKVIDWSNAKGVETKDYAARAATFIARDVEAGKLYKQPKAEKVLTLAERRAQLEE